MKKNFIQNPLTLILVVLVTFNTFSQQWQWAKGVSLPYQPYGGGWQLSADPSGSFYLSCAKWDQNNGWPAGSCVIKYDANGNEQWRRTFHEKLRIQKIQSDYFGNLLVAGDFRDTIHIEGNTYTSLNNDGFLMSLSSSSVITWFQQISGPGDESANDLHRDNQGNFFVTGAFTNQTSINGTTLSTIANSSSFIMKFDISGNNLLMFTTSGTASTSVNSGYRIQTDNSGNIFLLGHYDQVTIDTTSLYDGNPYGAEYLAKFNASGNLIFLKHIIDGTESFKDFKATDSCLYFTGNGGWTSGAWTKTQKYSQSGNLLWTKSHSGFYYEYSSNNIALNDSGFYTIGMQANPNVPSWVPTYDLMLSHFSHDGQENCTFISSAGRIDGYDITKTSDNGYLILGYMPDTISFGNITLTQSNGNFFIAKFTEQSIVTSITDITLQSIQFMVVPNPSPGQFEVHLKDPVNEGKVTIYDATGNCIIQKTISNTSRVSFDLQNEPKGIYLVNIETGKEKISKKIIFN